MSHIYLVLPLVNISFSGKRLFAGKSDELEVTTETEVDCLESLIKEGKLQDITEGAPVESEDSGTGAGSEDSGEGQEPEELDLDAMSLEQLKALADEEKIEYGTTIGEDTLRQRIFDHFESEDGE